MEYIELEKTAAKMRLLALESIHAAQSGHIGGSLSICDILAVLYWNVMKIDPALPQNPDRDRFVLSKGHAAPAYYAALAMKGYYSLRSMWLGALPNTFL